MELSAMTAVKVLQRSAGDESLIFWLDNFYYKDLRATSQICFADGACDCESLCDVAMRSLPDAPKDDKAFSARQILITRA